jgi:hypothetical protein
MDQLHHANVLQTLAMENLVMKTSDARVGARPVLY